MAIKSLSSIGSDRIGIKMESKLLLLFMLALAVGQLIEVEGPRPVRQLNNKFVE